MQIANVFACRSETVPVSVAHLLSNKLIVLGIGVELALIAAIVYTPLGHRLFGTAAIGWTVWAVAVPFGFALIALDRLWKRGFDKSCRVNVN